jgi:predicted  nucleic acid-binding Zn-ribbon protein
MNKLTDSERVAVIETEVNNIKTSINQHVKEQRSDFSVVFKKLDTLKENLESKFAGKWVEKISIGVLITTIASVIILLVSNIGV